jgi:putative permease
LELLKNWFKRSFSDPQVVILGLFLVIGFAVIIGLGKWLAPMFASLVIAYLLEAIVSRLQKFGMPRMPAVIIVFLLFLTFLLFLLFGLVPIVTRQLTQLVQQLPDYIAQGQTLLKQLPQRDRRDRSTGAELVPFFAWQCSHAGCLSCVTARTGVLFSEG